MQSNFSSQLKSYAKELRKQFPSLSDTSIDLLLSASTQFNEELSTAAFSEWLDNQNNLIQFDCELISLKEIKDWHFDQEKNLRHVTNKFFSIEGIKVKVLSNDKVKEWSQPIINQPEIGILGILCQKRSGLLYFLMQAKMEPGNVNKAQLSPTLQATKSNFTQVHGGKSPPYLEYFQNLSDKTIIVDQLQSEQGARFLRKRNRNMIIEVDRNIHVNLLNNYCWLTLGQLKHLIKQNNIINMDARTVLSCTQLNFS